MKHFQHYLKYTERLRTEKFEGLKRGLKFQQSSFTKLNTEEKAATRVSLHKIL